MSLNVVYVHGEEGDHDIIKTFTKPPTHADIISTLYPQYEIKIENTVVVSAIDNHTGHIIKFHIDWWNQYYEINTAKPLLKEIVLPKNATNADVIMGLYPKAKIEEWPQWEIVKVDYGDSCRGYGDSYGGSCPIDWWNALFEWETNQTVEFCEDCISRESVIHAILKEYASYGHGYMRRYFADQIKQTCIDLLSELPNIKPKAKKGQWLGISYDGYADGNPVIDIWECSECGYEHNGEVDTLTVFCPNCGAEMESEDKE